MNIIEGEFDPMMTVMTVITIIIVFATLWIILPYINTLITIGVCHCP
jgi:hypothetical protein